MIEGLFSLLFKEREPHNPELAPELVDAALRDHQLGSGRVRLLDPPIHTLNELLKREQSMFLTLLAAYAVHGIIPEGCLIGGLAVAAYTGKIYRAHNDIDVLLPKYRKVDFLGIIAEDLGLTIHTLGPNISRFSLSGERILATFSEPSQTLVETFRESKVTVDIFDYDEDGIPFDFSGGQWHIDLGSQYPLRPDFQELLTMKLKVAPLPVLRELKRLDTREKGQLDYQRLLEISKR